MRKSRKREKKPAASEPMVFEHAPVERPYDRIAKRVLAAVEEMNQALTEAHECVEMRVFIGASKPDGEAMRFQPQIYNLTHTTLTYRVTMDDSGKVKATEEKEWRQVKDPAFKDAAGQAFNAMGRKAKAANKEK